MTNYPVSVAAYRFRDGSIMVAHAAGLIPAGSKDEALGKATRLAERVYPDTDGWSLLPSCVGCTIPEEPENFLIGEIIQK